MTQDSSDTGATEAPAEVTTPAGETPTLDQAPPAAAEVEASGHPATEPAPEPEASGHPATEPAPESAPEPELSQAVTPEVATSEAPSPDVPATTDASTPGLVAAAAPDTVPDPPRPEHGPVDTHRAATAEQFRPPVPTPPGGASPTPSAPQLTPQPAPQPAPTSTLPSIPASIPGSSQPSEAGEPEPQDPAAPASNDWGRVEADGTAYVRQGGTEREIGSWQAGTPAEGLAHYARRFEVLSTEIALLEQRLRAGAGDPLQVAQSASRLKSTVPSAPAVGDLAALERRVDALLERTAEAVEAGKAKKAEARARAAEAKAGLAEEAEQLAGSSEWKSTGERLRTLGEDWKRLPHLDKKTEDGLWQRIAAARTRFTERRTTHFAALEEQRSVSQQRKEKLIKEAEQLTSSTEWGPTAGRYKQLMTDWKTAGRAPREVEDTLWGRFKAAQDAFFIARNAHFSTQDEELRGNQKIKEDILVEAETIDPGQGLDRAKARLRTLQERWENAGKVPRDVMRSLEDRMGAVEEKVRGAGETRFQRQEESPFTVRLREKVAELEGKLAKAQAAGRPTEDLQAALTTQRQWLSQAGGDASPPAPAATAEPAHPARKKPTTAWVRAE